MEFDLKTIEALAPDQASLSAASKLTKRSNWPRLEKNEQQALIWGECQGSGSNPYRVVVDTGDHGYKCTCPSRKFPCKHTLALMWIAATAPARFTAAESTPEWVNDWLGRRRKTTAQPARPPAGAATGKSIGEAAGRTRRQPSRGSPRRPSAARRRRRSGRKIRGRRWRPALDELDQWIADQLRLGLSGFVDASSERCRRIAARLVDMKATALAGRIDEIPARLMALRSEERPEAAIRELGKLVLLAKAWRVAPDDPELKRLVSTLRRRASRCWPIPMRRRSTALGGARREDRDPPRRSRQPRDLAARPEKRRSRNLPCCSIIIRPRPAGARRHSRPANGSTRGWSFIRRARRCGRWWRSARATSAPGAWPDSA